MTINKKDVIQLLERIALLLELKGENIFRISAYRRAAQGLERDERSLAEIDDFTNIKGIGQGTNAIIKQFLHDGTCTLLEQLEQEVPGGLIGLLSIPGLGGKRIATLYQELGITDIESLEKCCKSGEVEQLAGFGKKTVENILLSIQQYGQRPDRLPIASMLPIASKIEKLLAKITAIEQFSIAGSLRRLKETIKDIDFIIATNDPLAVRDELLTIPHKEIIAFGETKISLVIASEYDVNIDFRLVSPAQYATTLHHFTGSKEHNVAMRQLAKSRGEKINEYGIEVESTEEIITFHDENEFFKHFHLNYIPPELRQNQGEITAFQHEVPLIQQKDIRGDLHMHTTWSDGAQSIEEMVLHARVKGYEYIAITDHSKSLRIANGLSENQLLRQREEIAKLNDKYDDIQIYAGVEMDILPDGTLDYSNDILQQLDFVIAAIHSSFTQSQEQIMNRLFNALENPYVSLIAHPTGRLIGRREGYDVHMEKLFERAKETNTALEINANPHRFDLSAKWATLAHEIGVLLAINTDAHNLPSFDYMDYGVRVARKGWVEKESVINTWSTEKLTTYLK